MEVQLPPLPYKTAALEPVISARALSIHYEGHQKDYVARLNAMPEIQDLPEATALEDVVLEAARSDIPVDPFEIPQRPESSPMFDMAAQVWNHTFFWNSLAPEGAGIGGEPHGPIKDSIRINYGTFERFRETARNRAMAIFGSGWLWLCMRGDALYCIGGRNAATPLVYGMAPILCIDMWEHAYYLDYANDRGAYFDAVMDKLINWNFANENILSAVF